MSEARVVGAFATLTPSTAQVARMQARIESRLATAPRSLAQEWLSALRARPLMNGAWVLAAAAILFLSTPHAAVSSLAYRAATDRTEVARANEAAAGGRSRPSAVGHSTARPSAGVTFGLLGKR